jgi:hypothetical protein
MLKQPCVAQVAELIAGASGQHGVRHKRSDSASSYEVRGLRGSDGPYVPAGHADVLVEDRCLVQLAATCARVRARLMGRAVLAEGVVVVRVALGRSWWDSPTPASAEPGELGLALIGAAEGGRAARLLHGPCAKGLYGTRGAWGANIIEHVHAAGRDCRVLPTIGWPRGPAGARRAHGHASAGRGGAVHCQMPNARVGAWA